MKSMTAMLCLAFPLVLTAAYMCFFVWMLLQTIDCQQEAVARWK